MKSTAFVMVPLLAILAGATFEPVHSAPDADEITILVSPQTILLSTRAKGPQNVRVTVHAEIDYGDVATYTVELAGIPAVSTFADARGDLVAKFVFEEVAALLEVGEATLTLAGERKDGTAFFGEDTVRVTE